MNPDERTLIEGLFTRLAPLSSQPKDAEAEALIRAKVAAQSDAPYFLAQSTIVLQGAVEAAQARISDLERQLAAARSTTQQGGFLSGLFGGSPASVQAQAPQPPPIPASPSFAPPSSGGGFLKSAAATAAGVAGGALLFQGIENLMGHGGGGFAGPAGVTEITNNYYGNDPGQDPGQNQGDLASAPDSIPDDQDDPDMFASDGGFDGGDDSSFV